MSGASINTPTMNASTMRDAPTARAAPTEPRRRYRIALDWLFNISNSLRMLTYLPTLWLIYASGSSTQHSLITWGTWLVSNLTMCAWLHEQNGRRLNRAVVVAGGNSVMCLLGCLLILASR